MGDVLESLCETYAAVPSSLARARRAVTDIAAGSGATRDEVDRIRLAASEALTNVILHAYGDRPGEIHVIAAMAGHEFWLLVADDGAGLHQGGGKSGLGLGLSLIAHACEELTIVQRSGGGTELRMRFRLAGAPPAVDGQLRGSVSSARSPVSPTFSTTR
ncbi:MAG TPA: ATP-binding protein [Solirubrobacteraceae bacterium]|jgi:anti-sigma regulatory factor (Ser/Thr protein kinase)|nr:ATP-binding protein [Solirubrobacteraceae bacterium]